MKGKKFKLEKNVVEEVYVNLKNLLSRAKSIIAFIEENQPEQQYVSNVLILYSNHILNYMHELEKLLSQGGKQYLITQELIEKLGNYKKVLVELEEQFHNNSNLSLKVH